MSEEGPGDGGAGGDSVNDFDGGWAEVGESFCDGAEGTGRRDRGAKGIGKERTGERVIE